MSDSNSAVLQRAFELVEAGQAAEAQHLIESVLDQEQTNPDAWWIYAHALEDPAQAREALNEVLTLDPNYPGAASLRAVLDSQYPELTQVSGAAGPVTVVSDGDDLFDEPEDALLPAEDVIMGVAAAGEPVLTDEEPLEEPGFVREVPPAVAVVERERERGIPWLWYLAAAAGIVLLLAAILLLLNRPMGSVTESVTATLDGNAVAGLPTLEPGAQVVVTGAVLPVGEVTEESTGGTAPIGEATQVLPAEVATLPLESVVTLTPLPPGEPTAEVPDVVVGEVTAEPTPEGAGTTPVSEETALPQPDVTSAAQAIMEGVPEGVLPADDLASLASDLTTYPVPESALTIQTTPMGETLVASFCTQEGPQLRDLTRQVMDTVAARAQILEAGLTAVGVRAVNCETGETLRLLSAERGAAESYTQGAITREAFESQWLSL